MASDLHEADRRRLVLEPLGGNWNEWLIALQSEAAANADLRLLSSTPVEVFAADNIGLGDVDERKAVLQADAKLTAYIIRSIDKSLIASAGREIVTVAEDGSRTIRRATSSEVLARLRTFCRPDDTVHAVENMT